MLRARTGLVMMAALGLLLLSWSEGSAQSGKKRWVRPPHLNLRPVQWLNPIAGPPVAPIRPAPPRPSTPPRTTQPVRPPTPTPRWPKSIWTGPRIAPPLSDPFRR